MLLILVVINPVTSEWLNFMKKQNQTILKIPTIWLQLIETVFGLKKIKEENLFIINADRLENNNLIDVSINIISNENIIIERIEADRANISTNNWKIKKAKHILF